MFENYLAWLIGCEENKPLNRKCKLRNGTLQEIDWGVIKLTPFEMGPELPLILSCGIHGNETAPIEMVDKILSSLSQEQLEVSRPLLLCFGHVEAMRIHKRFVEFNLNRLFNQAHQSKEYLETPLARNLENHVNSFTQEFGRSIHLDLHTAIRPSHIQKFAIAPLKNGQDLEGQKILETLGIQAVVHTKIGGTTFSNYSKQVHDHIAFTLELGKVEPFGKNNHEDFKDTFQGLIDLIQSRSGEKRSTLRKFEVKKELIRDSEEYVFHICDDYVNFSPLSVDQLIETNREGDLKASESECIVFPNPEVPIGQRTGLLLKEKA